MKTRFPIKPRRTIAFTLVEVLVAELIFLVLLVIVVQLIFGVIQTVGAQKKRMDALADARQSLDRLSLDWSARVRRTDVLAALGRQAASSTNAANAQISFLSQVQAYSGARHMAWVSYSVNNVDQVTGGSVATTTPALVRGILGYNFSSTDPTGAANPLMSFPWTSPATTAMTVEPLADTVFRFDYCFIQQVPTPPTATTTSAYTINNALSLASTNVIGVVVAVASLDQPSRQIVNLSQLVAMGNALPTIAEGQTPQAQWVNSINDGTFAAAATTAGVPKRVSNAVHVYQRVLYIKE